MQADIDLELKKQAAAEHPGLCGLYHALVIAAVKTLDVEAQWGGLYYWQQVSQPSQMIFMSASHACHMHTRSYSCSLCKQAKAPAHVLCRLLQSERCAPRFRQRK